MTRAYKVAGSRMAKTLFDVATEHAHEHASKLEDLAPIRERREVYGNAKHSYHAGFLAGYAYRLTHGEDNFNDEN